MTDPTVHAATMPLWTVRRRPHPRLVIAAIGLGAVFLVASALLVPALMTRPDRRVGLAVGAFLGAFLVASVGRGSSASVDANGRLTFGWGNQPNLRLDLRAVAGVRAVRAGLLVGVGLAIPADQVEILHHKGLSRRKMRDQAKGLGAIVLEHLTAADAEAIERLRQRFHAS